MSGRSGYVDCGCRDCSDIAIGLPGCSLCADCEDAGCGINESECQREDAYTTTCGHPNRRAVDEFNEECIDCGITGPYDDSRGTTHGAQR